jgi:hypothetical protein
MIDTSNWTYFYKIVNDELQPTNLMYTPLVNPEQNVMCMKWDETSDYQTYNKSRLTKDLIDFFFAREVKYIQAVQHYDWAPKLIDIDMNNRLVFMEWNKETLNNIVFTPSRDLNAECPDWREQIFTILSDIVKSNRYKMALYPHCFFVDQHGKIKTFDFYSCVDHDDRFIKKTTIDGMIGPQSVQRFESATTDGMIDFEIFFKHTVREHLANAWPDNPFPEFYRRLYND